MVDRHPRNDAALDRVARRQLENAIDSIGVYYELMQARSRCSTPYFPDESYAANRLRYELKEVKASHERRSAADREYYTSDIMHDILERGENN